MGFSISLLQNTAPLDGQSHRPLFHVNQPISELTESKSPDNFLRRLHPMLGSRKELQDEIRKIEILSQMNLSKKTALILEANGSVGVLFDLPTRCDIPLIRKLAKTHAVEYYPIADYKNFVDILNQLEKSHKVFDMVLIRAHSNKNGMLLGDFFFNGLYAHEMKVLGNLVRKDGQIILYGCEPAKGIKNFARLFSYFVPKATVHASDSLCHTWWGMKWKENCIPHFRSLFGFNATRAYRNGEIIQKNSDQPFNKLSQERETAKRGHFCRQSDVIRTFDWSKLKESLAALWQNQ